MAQLFSAFGVEWKLLLAQAVNFGIVMVALWYFLYRPVTTMLEKRRTLIEKGVADATQATEMLANADAQAASRVKDADNEADQILTSAREAAQAERARLLKEAETRAVQVAADASARAAETAAKARRESEQEVARLAILAAEKVMKGHHD